MYRFLLAGAMLATFAAAPSVAQPGGEARGPAAGPLTRAAVAARVQARFERADANRDGFVTQDEVRARADARGSRRHAAGGDRREARGERREQRFERLDTNRDGSISRAEFDSRPAMGRRGERRGEGFAHRGGGRRGHGGAMIARFGARAFSAMDANKDGRVALQEANRAALQRFDRVDADRDGTISPTERQAAREAFRERRQARQGD